MLFINIHPLYIVFSSDLLNNYKQHGTKENVVFQVC